jgi:predicted TIM-barrel fold metal-dependent hydrolase
MFLNHPYETAPPDHPLFLSLSDIAADNEVPIDIHMEAVLEEMPFPARLESPPNQKVLRPNIGAFEKLLAYNRKTKIIWAHVGWDNTGHRTAALCKGLLEKHANLFVSIKFGLHGYSESRLMERGHGIKPEWFEVIEEFPDRFLIGSDQFYSRSKVNAPFPRGAEISKVFLSLLPKRLARKIGYENAERLFNL